MKKVLVNATLYRQNMASVDLFDNINASSCGEGSAQFVRKSSQNCVADGV